MGSKTVVVKVADINLARTQISIVNGKKYKVNEDIFREQNILKKLSQRQCPESIVKFHRFVKTKRDFYLVEEDGGSPLFEFVDNMHKLIKMGKVDIKDWHKTVQIIYKQMVECIDFLHSQNIAHFDISLENFLISTVHIEVQKRGESEKIKLLTDDIQIKLCDFGLAETFDNTQCHSSKHCGKRSYKSPEVVNKNKLFDAKKNDIWCVGVCLFMMVFGCRPFVDATMSDAAFQWIMSGKTEELLAAWDKAHYVVDSSLIDLIQNIFKYEIDRMSLKSMKNHPWIN